MTLPIPRNSRVAAMILAAAAFLELAPVVVRAQQAEFDTWREDFRARLDASLARLRNEKEAGRRSPILVAPRVSAETAGQPAPRPSRTEDERQNRLPVLAGILRANGLPPSLMGVAAVESGFNPQALSPKGARGLWQLMPATARRYGLRVGPYRDERTHPLKSTYAAARYMRDLFAQFRDWPLALAAYNAGEDRVARALDRTGARDFWTLRRRAALPEETLRYVPAVLAKGESPVISLEQGGPFSSADGTAPAGHIVYAATTPQR